MTLGQLIAAGLSPTAARMFLSPLVAACAAWDVNTPERIAGLIGQCMVESNNFTVLEENLYYRAERLAQVFPSRVPNLATAQQLVTRGPQAIANCVYAGKNGNGDETSGDGWRYRGRGLIQLTGRSNYKAAADGNWQSYLEAPDAVATPEHACLTAAWYWATRGCNVQADHQNWNACTLLVNGRAMLEKERRALLSEQALHALLN